MGLSYDQVASPTTLVKDPSLFYGFWMNGLNRYKETPPHEGYSILKKWKDSIPQRKGQDVIIQDLQTKMKRNANGGSFENTRLILKEVQLPQGNTFVVTSVKILCFF